MSEPANQVSPPLGRGVGVPPLIRAAASGRRLWWLWVAAALLLVFLVAVLFFFNPAQHSFYPFCVFYRVTGWQCPGCGGLRAVHQLLHGHLATAFQFNPLVVLAIPLLLVLALRRLWRGAGRPASHRAMARWAWVTFTVLVLFWIVRNLPLEWLKMPPG